MLQIAALPSHMEAVLEIRIHLSVPQYRLRCNSLLRSRRHLSPSNGSISGFEKVIWKCGYARTHIHTQHRAQQWITLAFSGVWRDWEPSLLQKRSSFQCAERKEKKQEQEFNLLCWLLEMFHVDWNVYHYVASKMGSHKHLCNFITLSRTDGNTSLRSNLGLSQLSMTHWCIVF